MSDQLTFPATRNCNRVMTTCNAALSCGWALDAHESVLAAERAEPELSYSLECNSEGRRKLAGAYYTPADVADHFWKIFFERRNIATQPAARQLLESCYFIEPSVGAGALFFSLLKGLADRGLPPDIICTIRADLIDINQQALDFIGSQIAVLEQRWRVKFDGIRLICGNFLNYSPPDTARMPVFFGNPPFVTNERGASKWKNLYADFVERSLGLSKEPAHLHYILPLSIAFSRDYSELRSALRSLNAEISLASYDNIPDTLFKSGKPKHTNTNKANSQRCSILTVVPSACFRLYASRLHRWNKAERPGFLSSLPTFYDVGNYGLDDQIPRPASRQIAHYLHTCSGAKRLAAIVEGSTRFQLVVACVARNYISFRSEADTHCTVLGFEREENFLTALGVMASRLFFEYWLSLGDGFHLTKSTILNFPLAPSVENEVRLHHDSIRRFWQNRQQFEKTKLNNGIQTRSYDFSTVAPELSFTLPDSDMCAASGKARTSSLMQAQPSLLLQY